MYFPYFRGRQNELLALKEMLNKDLLSDCIIPIIEPVSMSSTLISTLEAFISRDRKIGFVVNPEVGEFCLDNPKKSRENDNFIKIKDNLNILKTKIIGNSDVVINCKYDIAIINNSDNIDSYLILNEKFNFKYSLIPDKSNIRRKVKNNLVLFENHFNKGDKNADYADNIDEPFSEDHLFYKDENYLGFGDFSIIGNDFTTSGFAPRAIAIHIVYFDKNNGLRIRHFVSDSNEDIQNPAKKYHEAVTKLSKWVNDQHIQITKGLDFFLNSASAGTYHGLGIIKKYSIMHHLEIMSQFLNIEKKNELL